MPKTTKTTKRPARTGATHKRTTKQHRPIARATVRQRVMARMGGFATPMAFVGAFMVIGITTLAWASAASTTYSIWNNSTIPKTLSSGNPRSVELGLKFKSSVTGYVTGVRFYKGARNTGTHTGSLWSKDGRLLATTTFSHESASGWQTASFARPVSIAANVTYVISYYAPKGQYSVNTRYFSGSAHTNQKLTAPKAVARNDNGVYKYTSNHPAFPSSGGAGNNYWVDVVFTNKLVSAPAAPAAPGNLVANLNGKNGVALSWNASASAAAIKNYQVFRGGTKIANPTTTSYIDANLATGKSYEYTVKAVDSNGMASTASVKVTITVPTPAPSGGTTGGSTGGGGNSNTGPGGTSSGSTANLFNASKKEIAMQLVSSAENSSLNWKAQYGYIEDIKDGRGYTGGIIGFCSGCSDMAKVVGVYNGLKPNNVLAKYYNTLVSLGNAESASHSGLDPNFTKDWKTAATDPLFQQAQDSERDRVYFNPSVNQGIADGLHSLGQFIYYDAIVMHGPGSDPVSFGGIRAAAMKKAKTPAQGGNETTYLNAFLDARKAAMLTEEAHSDTDRVDTEQRVFLKAGNLNLDAPLSWTVYGDSYSIAKNP